MVWRGIFLGAFAVNLTTAGSILSSLGIASGNTLEALVGAYLVMRFANGRKVFDRAEDIFKFLLFAYVVATTVSASVGTASLFLTGFSRGMQQGSLWLTWWLGDMAGAILVTLFSTMVLANDGVQKPTADRAARCCARQSAFGRRDRLRRLSFSQGTGPPFEVHLHSVRGLGRL